MTARLSNNGYLMIAKQPNDTTPAAPSIAVPLYEESFNTNGNFQDISASAGSKFATHSTIPGVRSHTGELTAMFEPNTAAHLFNALLTKGASSGTDPATHPFTLGDDSASYTFDISMGNIVKRMIGVKVSKISIAWEDNEGRASLTVSALASFDSREIGSVTGAGPYTVTLKDPNGVYDGRPTKGLVVGDLIRFRKADGTTVDATVATIPDGTTFTTSTSPAGVAAGDAVHLRPATPNLNNQQPFLWSKTRFHFGATATAALSAAHTPVEKGSSWEVMHDFADADGAARSGSFDRASLDRTTGNISLSISKLTDTPEDLTAFKNMNKSACVVRHYAGATNQYELRLTYNALVTDTPLGNVKTGELVLSKLSYHSNLNQTDGQAFDVKVLNGITV